MFNVLPTEIECTTTMTSVAEIIFLIEWCADRHGTLRHSNSRQVQLFRLSKVVGRARGRIDMFGYRRHN
jgi:uncharacterized paraquat-inducible protein A